MKGRVALIGVWLILSGCSYLTESISGLVRVSAMEYLDWAFRASEADRQTELNSLQTLPETQSPITRATKIGVLLSVRGGTSADGEAYALSMLEILDGEMPVPAAERDYLQLGLLVRELLVQRQELRRAEQARADLQQQVDTLNSDKRLLQSQIEALKNIETQINERQQQENGDGASSN